MATQFDFVENGSDGSGFIYKNNKVAYVFSTAVFEATTGTGTAVMNILSVTSGTVVVGMTLTGGTLSGTRTITSFGTFNGSSGTVNLSGTDTWANPTTVSGSGYIQITDADYPTETVRGICYLDGTYYVMTPQAAIYGSDINDPFTWSALNVIQANAEPDLGVALFRQLNLLCAFGEYSTQFFYDAGNPTGSPLLPYSSANLEIGCASAESVAQAENTLFFIGKARQRGRTIYKLDGTNLSPPLSTAFVDRILNEDDLVGVTSFFIKVGGHGFYILTLPSSSITLVYDVGTGLWAKWTQLQAGDAITPSAGTWLNGEATLIMTDHGISDGDYVVVASSNPSGYNYSGAVNVHTVNTIAYPIASDPGAFVGSAVVTPYTETYFNMGSYTKDGNLDLVQDSTTGTVYTVSTDDYQDNNIPIKFNLRTSKFDAGNNKEKYFAKLELIGDKVDATGHVRYSDDDYQTWSKYRAVDLEAQRSQLYRLGRGRRRAFDIINYDNQPIRLEAMDITISEGIR
jgi:hypothetical protein